MPSNPPLEPPSERNQPYVFLKMERIMEEASTIQRLLPWIHSDEDVINYLRRIPLDKNHLRFQLTLLHFLNERDKENNSTFEQDIEDDAREIVSSLPETPYKVVKERLTVLGNMSNRKEVVIRQLLHEKRDLGTLLSELDFSNVHKRKNGSDFHSVDNGERGNETNIKIKIRKVEGSLEVVSSFKQEMVTPSTKVNIRPSRLTRPQPSAVEISSSSDSIDLPHSSTTFAHPRSVNEKRETISAAKFMHPYPPPPERNVNNNNEERIADDKFMNTLNNIIEKKVLKQFSKSSKPATVVNSTMDTELPEASSDIDTENFDLVAYLKEVTQVEDEKIRSLCNLLDLPLNERPHHVILNDILNRLMSNDVIVLEDGTPDTESDEELSSHLDGFLNYMGGSNSSEGPIEDHPPAIRMKIPSPFYGAKDQQPNEEEMSTVEPTFSYNYNPGGPGAATNFTPITKEPSPRASVILREPRFTVPSSPLPSTITSYPTENPSASEPLNLTPPYRPLIQPARFSGESKMPEVRPAIDAAYMDHLQTPSRKEPEIKRNMPVAIASTSHQPDFPTESAVQVSYEEVSPKKRKVVDQKLVLRLIEMFPQACPDYIRSVCQDKTWEHFDDLITVILAEDYPKRRPPSPPVEVDLEQQLEIVKDLLPDADPTYLRVQCEMIGNNPERLNEFICDARETKKYPTMKEYLRKQKLSAQSKQYTTEFNVENFVELFPEPEKSFTDPKRIVNLSENYTTVYITHFFQNRYDKLLKRVIISILNKNSYRIIDSDKAMAGAMKNKSQEMRSRRKRTAPLDVPQNIMVLQEIAYLTHKEEIENFIQEKKLKEQTDRQHAKENGLMKTCQCCFEEEVMPKDTFYCPKECMFCRDCIQRSCEVALGEGKTQYKCLNDCPEEFSLKTLQNVLPPKMFSKLAQKKSLAEVKAAGIPELEMCPFCDFASIPNETDKIFKCLNPDCMKESCRLCKEENHVPYRCDELEKDEEVKARTFLENKMSEALLRKCWKCGLSFYKEEGCNKMTCPCGAQMCYICKKPVTDYIHFNGIGGDKFDRCPLYSDSNEVNKQNVIGAVEAAKAQIDPTKLKVDPSSNIQQHFSERRKVLPREPHLDVVNDVRNQLQQLRQQQLARYPELARPVQRAPLPVPHERLHQGDLDHIGFQLMRGMQRVQNRLHDIAVGPHPAHGRREPAVENAPGRQHLAVPNQADVRRRVVVENARGGQQPGAPHARAGHGPMGPGRNANFDNLAHEIAHTIQLLRDPHNQVRPENRLDERINLASQTENPITTGANQVQPENRLDERINPAPQIENPLTRGANQVQTGNRSDERVNPAPRKEKSTTTGAHQVQAGNRLDKRKIPLPRRETPTSTGANRVQASNRLDGRINSVARTENPTTTGALQKRWPAPNEKRSQKKKQPHP